MPELDLREKERGGSGAADEEARREEGYCCRQGERDCRQGGERDTKRESSRPPATEVSGKKGKKKGGREIPPANFDRSMLNWCIDQSNSAVSC